jgi:hypothetical protein
MNEEHNRAEEQRYAGLTTAALADAGEVHAGSESSFGDNRVALAPIAAAGAAGAQETLLSAAQAKEFRVRWDTIQVGFVDEPRSAVEQADNLVAGAMKRLAEIFADERAKLEGQWDRKESVSTEDLRLALRRYRSFFVRLLSV